MKHVEINETMSAHTIYENKKLDKAIKIGLKFKVIVLTDNFSRKDKALQY